MKAAFVTTKKRALKIVLFAALVLLALILLRALINKAPGMDSVEGRQAFLTDMGWEIDPASEDHKTVILPDSLDGALSDYAALQERQGYDLASHLGERCEQYSYRVLNYPDESQTVLVTLYLQDGRLIAGDLHSTALDGFMCGLDGQ